MKTKNYFFNAARLVMSLLVVMVLFAGRSYGQWEVFDASVLPDANTPVFGVSGSAGAGLVSTLIADPDNVGNHFMEMITADVADNGTWRRVYTDPVTDVTVIMRVKAANATGRRVVELDLDNGGFRERLYLNQEDNTLRLNHSTDFGSANEFSLPDNGSVAEWNIYRITKDAAGNVKLYVNEDITPLAEGQTTAATTNNHFRFGDTNGSHNISGLVDWVIWDVSGAYAPGQGTEIPAGLIPDDEEPIAHNWRIYDASVLPNEHGPEFDESNVSGTGTNVIVTDPDDSENSFLELITPTVGDNFMWRTPLQPETPGLTMVMKVKAANDEARRVVELDIHHNGIRERLYINRESNRVRLNEAIGGGDGGEIEPPAGTNLSDWNIYRITKKDGEIRLYLNEDPTPIAHDTTTTSTSNQYFRFGDGNGSHNSAALIDWIIWDETGAYAPSEGSAIPDPVVSPAWDASLTSIMVGGVALEGFDPEVYEYDYVLADDITVAPVVDVTPSDANATVSVVQATEIPGVASVEVTAANGFSVENYNINFRYKSDNTNLTGINLDTVALEGFDPAVLIYDVELPQGTTVAPVVTAVAEDENAEVVITQATELPGQATIVVTAEDQTQVTYEINFTLDGTNVATYKAFTLSIFPNPAGKIITISVTENLAGAVVEIINTAGQILIREDLTGAEQRIDVENLAPGAYIVLLRSEVMQTRKLFIRK